MLLSDQTGDNGGSTYRLQYYIGEMPRLINELMSVPDIPIWIHETALCKMLSMPFGEVYEQNSALTCIISTIKKKGKQGNAREGTCIAVDSCDFSIAAVTGIEFHFKRPLLLKPVMQEHFMILQHNKFLAGSILVIQQSSSLWTRRYWSQKLLETNWSD